MATLDFREIATDPLVSIPAQGAHMTVDQWIYSRTIYADIASIFEHKKEMLTDFLNCLHISYLESGDVEITFSIADLKLTAVIPSLRFMSFGKSDVYTNANLNTLDGFLLLASKTFLARKEDGRLSQIVDQVTQVLSWQDERIDENV